MTFCDIFVSRIIGMISGILSAYIVRRINKKHKNDRHQPKSGHFCVDIILYLPF